MGERQERLCGKKLYVIYVLVYLPRNECREVVPYGRKKGFIFIVVELNYCEKKGEGKEKREKEEKRKGRRERRKKRKKGEDGNLTTTKNYYYLDKPIGASPRVWFHSSSSSALI